MTMLDSMRRHRGWLKWSLGLVVLTFALFIIPTGSSCSRRQRPVRRRARWSPKSTAASCSAGEFQTRYLTQVHAVPAAVRRHDQRLAAPPARRRAAGADADDRRAGGADRSGAPGHPRQRRGAGAADLRDPGAAGERPLHRRGALRAAAAVAAAADDQEPVRREPAPEHDHRQAARRAHRLDGRSATPSSSASTGAATRRSSCRSSRSPPTRSATRSRSPTPTSPPTSSRARPSTASASSARSSTCCSIATSSGRRSSCRRPTSSAIYNDNLQQYQTPEQIRASHILLEHRRQGRGGGAQAGRGHPGQGQGRRRLRRAGHAVLGGRRLEGQRRRPRLLRPRPDGAGVRRGRVRDRSPARSATWSSRSSASTSSS